jgi:hypothetical protein
MAAEYSPRSPLTEDPDDLDVAELFVLCFTRCGRVQGIAIEQP